MFAERHPKLKPWVDSITIHLADVVVYAAGAQHRPRDAGIDRQLSRELAHFLCARDEDFIRDDQLLELIEKARKRLDYFPGAFHPIRSGVHPTAAKTHVVAHHARAGERLE